MIQLALLSHRAKRYLLLLGALLLVAPYALHAGSVGGTKHCHASERAAVIGNVAIIPALHVVVGDEVGSGNGEGGRATSLPPRIFMDQNYPNPFNPSTMIRYGLPDGSNVRITIHTLLGNQVKMVVDSYQDAGVYTLNLSAQDLPSGVYFYRLETNFGTLTRRMTIQK